MLDILITGGWVVDGTGNPARRADLAIEGDTIAEVGRISGGVAARVIDATGMHVMPGFIDAHSHSDWTLLSNPTAESAVRQGVTTEIVGNCGVSLAPVSSHSLAAATKLLRTYAYDGEVGWRSYAEYLETVASMGMSINYAYLVGHTAIRTAAGATGADVDEPQLRAMEALLAEAMESGALGMSTGLELEGKHAPEIEVTRLARVLRRYDAMYVSHIRNRDAHLQAAMDEFMRYAIEAGGRAQVSHLNVRANTGAPDGGWEQAVATIERARADGLDVLTDTISMTRGIGLMAGILPPDFVADGPVVAAARLGDPAVRRHLRTECDRYWRFIHRGEWHRVRLLASPQFPELNGLSFPEIAARRGGDEWDAFFDILAAAGPDMPKLIMYAELYSEEHLAAMVSHPLFMLAVDAMNSTVDPPLADMTGQPLVYAGQITYLTHHVLETGLLRLEEAVRKMTSMPAGHFGLRGRGLLQPGCAADVVVLDLERLRAPSTILAPAVYAEGVRDVLVNGVPVLDGGDHTGSRPGRTITR
ncbi:MAG: amidohydrolase family protein [Candidatus Limnocylindrales bacterium]